MINDLHTYLEARNNKANEDMLRLNNACFIISTCLLNLYPKILVVYSSEYKDIWNTALQMFNINYESCNSRIHNTELVFIGITEISNDELINYEVLVL